MNQPNYINNNIRTHQNIFTKTFLYSTLAQCHVSKNPALTSTWFFVAFDHLSRNSNTATTRWQARSSSGFCSSSTGFTAASVVAVLTPVCHQEFRYETVVSVRLSQKFEFGF